MAAASGARAFAVKGQGLPPRMRARRRGAGPEQRGRASGARAFAVKGRGQDNAGGLCRALMLHCGRPRACRAAGRAGRSRAGAGAPPQAARPRSRAAVR